MQCFAYLHACLGLLDNAIVYFVVNDELAIHLALLYEIIHSVASMRQEEAIVSS